MRTKSATEQSSKCATSTPWPVGHKTFPATEPGPLAIGAMNLRSICLPKWASQ